jgi:hypothetical protein
MTIVGRRIARTALVLWLISAGAAAPTTMVAISDSPFRDRWQEVADEVHPAQQLAQNASPTHRAATRPAPAPSAAPAPTAPKAQSAPQTAPVSLEQALYLIRSTLLTLNDANRSGNYTVLRDLAAPGFQSGNTAADLGTIFGDLRRRHVDLFAVALMAPQLSAAPAVDDKGMLRLSGHFPTQPLQIRFDLVFQNVDNQWRLYGISVQTPEVAPQANIPPATR